MSARELAKIKSTFLGVEDHGILTCYLHVEYEGGSGQGVGGYTLDAPRHDGDNFAGRFGTAEGMRFVAAIIHTVGAESWEKLPGQMVYVLREDDRYNARVIGLEGLGFGPGKGRFLFADIFEPAAAK